MKTFLIPIAALLAASSLSADFFGDAADSLTKSANESVEKAQQDATEAAQGKIAESTADAQAQVASAAATQKMVSNAVNTSKKLESMLSGNPELQSLLTGSMSSLAKGLDLSALQDLGALSAAKLTPEQSSLLKGLRSDVEVLALKRNLPDSGPITAATKAIQSGDVQTASAKLNQALASGQLNDSQKQLVSTVLQNYVGLGG